MFYGSTSHFLKTTTTSLVVFSSQCTVLIGLRIRSSGLRIHSFGFGSERNVLRIHITLFKNDDNFASSVLLSMYRTNWAPDPEFRITDPQLWIRIRKEMCHGYTSHFFKTTTTSLVVFFSQSTPCLMPMWTRCSSSGKFSDEPQRTQL
jgi:hypothetical protein